MKGHHIFAYTAATAAAAAAVLFSSVFTATPVSASKTIKSIRGASDSVDSTHYLLTKEAEVEVGVAITSDSLKDHPAADATFFKIAKSESKLALYDEEAIEDEDPEDFEVEVESSNSNPSQEGEYDEYGDEDEMGLESFHEDVSGDGDEIGALLNTLPSLSQCGDPPPGTIGLGIRFPEGTALDIIASSANLAPDRLKCFSNEVVVKNDRSETNGRPTMFLNATYGIHNDEWIDTFFQAVLPGQSDGCECGLRIDRGLKYKLFVWGCDCFHITHYYAGGRPYEGNVWPCQADGCTDPVHLWVAFDVEAN